MFGALPLFVLVLCATFNGDTSAQLTDVANAYKNAKAMVGNGEIDEAIPVLRTLTEQTRIAEIAMYFAEVLENSGELLQAQNIRLSAVKYRRASKQTQLSSLYQQYCNTELKLVLHESSTFMVNDDKRYDTLALCDEGAQHEPQNKNLAATAALLHVVLGGLQNHQVSIDRVIAIAADHINSYSVEFDLRRALVWFVFHHWPTKPRVELATSALNMCGRSTHFQPLNADVAMACCIMQVRYNNTVGDDCPRVLEIIQNERQQNTQPVGVYQFSPDHYRLLSVADQQLLPALNDACTKNIMEWQNSITFSSDTAATLLLALAQLAANLMHLQKILRFAKDIQMNVINIYDVHMTLAMHEANSTRVPIKSFDDDIVESFVQKSVWKDADVQWIKLDARIWSSSVNRSDDNDAMMLTSDDWLPLVYPDKTTEMVTISECCTLFGKAVLLFTEKYVFVKANGDDFAVGTYAEPLQTGNRTHVTLNGLSAVVATSVKTNWYIDFIECGTKLALIYNYFMNNAQVRSLDTVLITDSPFLRAFVELLALENLIDIVWLERNGTKQYELEKALFVHYTYDKSVQDAIEVSWVRNDALDARRPPRHALKLLRKTILNLLPLHEPIHADVVFISHSNDTSTPAFTLEDEAYLIAQLQQRLGHNKIYVFDGETAAHMSLNQIRNVFVSAKVIVGAHGAGFANMIFCQHATLVYIPTRPLFDVSLAYLAAVFNLEVVVVNDFATYMFEKHIAVKHISQLNIIVDAVQNALEIQLNKQLFLHEDL